MRRRLAAASALVALAAAVALPAPAGAAGYQVESCRSSEGDVLPTSAWRFRSSGRAGGRAFQRRYDLCAEGAGIGIVLPARGLRRRDAVQLTFTVPRGTRATGITLTRRFAVAGQVRYRMIALRRGARPRVLESCVGRRCQSRLAPDRRVSTTLPRRVSRIVLELRCPRRRCAVVRGSSGSAALFIQRAAVDLRDATPPRLRGSARGQLFGAPQGQGGLRTFGFTASDVGGGLRAATLEIDGRPALNLPIGGGANACQPPYIIPRPCVTRARRTFTLDTAQYENGPHEVRLVLTDVAGLRTSTTPRLVSFFNPSRPEPFSFITAGVSLTQAGPARASRVVPFGRGAFVKGRLTQPGGAPVAGATVRGFTRVFGFNGQAGLAPVTTDPNGFFTFFVPAGPARTISVVHDAGSGNRASETRTTFDVQAEVEFSLRPRRVGNGGSVRLSGRVRGAGPGVLVELQARRGSRYQTFATTSTNSAGRFRYRYRFSRTPRPTRYSLRARVARQGGLAYSTGASRARSVRVG